MIWKLKEKIANRYNTQADFAQALGVSESVVSRVIRGRRKLNDAERSHWANILNCTPKEVFRV